MDPAQVFALLTTIIFLGFAFAYAALAEYRTLQRQREEQQRELLLALFRMNKRHARHVDALGTLLLRELRARRVDPALLAEVEREVDTARTLAAEEEAAAEEDAAGEERRRESGPHGE